MKEDPTAVQIEGLFNRKTLNNSLKKLLRVVIITDDAGLQLQQLVRVYKWYDAQSNALETKEGALAQKLKAEQQEKKRELLKVV